MAGYSLVPCLIALKAEFDHLAPGRDKESDGWIGDLAHQASKSDHNPDSRRLVHAIDVDKDLSGPVSMEQCVQAIVLRHRRGLDDRLQNIIWNGKIWSRSWGWTARTYTGANQHRKHAHFSARYTTAQEQDVRPWGVAALKPKPPPPKPAPTPREPTMATKDDILQALTEALQTAHPLPGAVGRRLHVPKPDGPGWGPMSDREILARLFEMTLGLARVVGGLAVSLAALTDSEGRDDAEQRALLIEMRALLEPAGARAPDTQAPPA